jgi:hypothetical protein
MNENLDKVLLTNKELKTVLSKDNSYRVWIHSALISFIYIGLIIYSLIHYLYGSYSDIALLFFIVFITLCFMFLGKVHRSTNVIFRKKDSIINLISRKKNFRLRKFII